MDSAGKDQGDALANPRLTCLLGHPLRARIAAEPNTSSRDSIKLAEVLEEPLPRVEYHCRVLELVGCKTVHEGDDGGQHRAHVRAGSAREGATEST